MAAPTSELSSYYEVVGSGGGWVKPTQVTKHHVQRHVRKLREESQILTQTMSFSKLESSFCA